MLVTSKEMLEKARREHYAVPAMILSGQSAEQRKKCIHLQFWLIMWLPERIQEMTGLWKYANGVQTK